MLKCVFTVNSAMLHINKNVIITQYSKNIRHCWAVYASMWLPSPKKFFWSLVAIIIPAACLISRSLERGRSKGQIIWTNNLVKYLSVSSSSRFSTLVKFHDKLYESEAFICLRSQVNTLLIISVIYSAINTREVESLYISFIFSLKHKH